MPLGSCAIARFRPNEPSAHAKLAPPGEYESWLPTELKLLRSTSASRRQLKTFLFQSAYKPFYFTTKCESKKNRKNKTYGHRDVYRPMIAM